MDPPFASTYAHGFPLPLPPGTPNPARPRRGMERGRISGYRGTRNHRGRRRDAILALRGLGVELPPQLLPAHLPPGKEGPLRRSARRGGRARGSVLFRGVLLAWPREATRELQRPATRLRAGRPEPLRRSGQRYAHPSPGPHCGRPRHRRRNRRGIDQQTGNGGRESPLRAAQPGPGRVRRLAAPRHPLLRTLSRPTAPGRAPLWGLLAVSNRRVYQRPRSGNRRTHPRQDLRGLHRNFPAPRSLRRQPPLHGVLLSQRERQPHLGQPLPAAGLHGGSPQRRQIRALRPRPRQRLAQRQGRFRAVAPHAGTTHRHGFLEPDEPGRGPAPPHREFGHGGPRESRRVEYPERTGPQFGGQRGPDTAAARRHPLSTLESASVRRARSLLRSRGQERIHGLQPVNG